MANIKKSANPYERRYSTSDYIDQVSYIDKGFRSEINTSVLQLYGCCELQAYPSGGKQKYPSPKNPFLCFYWIVSYLEKGMGHLEVNNERKAVQKGDIVIARPGINLKIIPDLGKPLKQIVLFVIASPVMECICCSDARQAYQICRLDDYTMFHESLRKLLDTVKNSTGNPRKALSVLTYAILCEIEKDNRKPKRLDQFNQIFYSIRQAPQYYKRVSDICREFGISRQQAFSMFQDRLGVSPMRHVISERLDKSRWYLIHQNTPVAAIAEFCGYSSVPFFSREFKKKYGISPMAYRKKYSLLSGRKTGEKT